MKKILIASTLKEHLEAEEAIFRRSKYKVFTASSGEEVLKIHAERKVDLIVADLYMDGMNGDKLCAHIRKKMDKGFRDVLVIIICENKKSDIDKCIKSRANLFITKPFNDEELLQEVRKQLNIRKREVRRIPLRVKIVGSDLYKTFFCYAHDLSTSGILIETDRILHQGKSIACLFCLPELPGQVSPREITINGQIVRVDMKPNNMYQYGIQFNLLTSSTKAILEHYVTQVS